MKSTKNSVTIALMISSLLLLLVLQFFWIKSAYRDAGEDFRKETNLLFRNTIFSMHDTLIERSLEPVMVGSDSGIRISRKEFFFTDTLKVAATRKEKVKVQLPENLTRIEIITSGSRGGDSLGRMLRPIMRNLQTKGEQKGSFIIKMLADSLDRDSIRAEYKKVLVENGIEANFDVVALHIPAMSRRERTLHRNADPFSTEIVPFSPITQYAATFTGIQSLLFKKISPQIVFSFFLTLLTGAAFYVMYRNLRAQQRLMQIKNDFISNVTHELKTPVATVSVALEALKNFRALDNPQKTTEYLDIAQSELNRLTLMTDKILKTSVYEDQGVEFKLEGVSLDQLTDQVLSSMKLVFEKRKITLSYTKRGIDFELKGSQAHLTNVLYNLIDNALKYSGDGATLDVTLENIGQAIRISIKDTGIGIPQEYQKKIFEKFFRVPSGDIHNIKGYGLGLSYVASVVKSHGGTIYVESELGKGSAFIINLPVDPEAAK